VDRDDSGVGRLGGCLIDRTRLVGCVIEAPAALREVVGGDDTRIPLNLPLDLCLIDLSVSEHGIVESRHVVIGNMLLGSTGDSVMVLVDAHRIEDVVLGGEDRINHLW
jgi:hypothetical protein